MTNQFHALSTFVWMKKEKKGISNLAIVSAFAASLCCIVPAFAALAGIGGLASTFSWIEPFRPYLIVVSIAVLLFAWYLQLRPKKIEADCDCEPEKVPFHRSNLFLGFITVFTICILCFPYYTGIFYGPSENNTVYLSGQTEEATFSVGGMTCSGCEEHIESEVSKIDGVVLSDASYEEGHAKVIYDKTKTNVEEIEQAISSTGYEVLGQSDPILSE